MNALGTTRLPLAWSPANAPVAASVPKATPWAGFVFWAAFHAGLGLLGHRVSAVATVHAWGVLAVGVAWALSSRPMEDVACLGAYVLGSEIFWRMTRAFMFWEMGKYVVAAVFLLACLRARPRRKSAVSFWFVALLLPSCALTFLNFDLDQARQQVSFNVSGPLAISACAAFFSRMTLTPQGFTRMMRAALLPIISVGTVVLYATLTAQKLRFGSESIRETSGGFGPNQVSSILALGATIAVLLLILFEPKRNTIGRTLLIGMVLVFASLSVLTFSRTGMYLAVASVVSAVIVTAANRRLRQAYFIALVTVYVLGAYVIYPRLNEFTGGALTKRYSDVGLTGRDRLIYADLDTWRRHPILGVGPGGAIQNRKHYFHALAAHCEMSRIVAEHGTLGFVALSILLAAVCKRIWTVKNDKLRGVLLASAAFGLLFMVSNAMRIVAPSFLIGLVFANERPDDWRIDYR